MSALTKMHPTEGACIRKPETEKVIPWREAFKENIEKDTEPGLALQGIRAREGLTQKELAEMLGIKTHHISEMEHGKRPIGKTMAHRLAKALHAGYRIFL